MSKTAVITARIDSGTLVTLDKLAEVFDRPRSWLVAQAMERYAKEELEFLACVQEGENALSAGLLFTQEQVEEMFKIKAGRQAV